MTDKRKKNEDEEEFLDLDKEYGIKEADLINLTSNNERGSMSVLRHRMKKVDEGVEKIEDGILDIAFVVDEIIDDYEEGKILHRDNGIAIERLFVFTDFMDGFQEEFAKFKKAREDV